MFGVIVKDVKNVKGQLLYYALVVAVFFAIGLLSKNVYFYAGAVVFVAAFLPLSALAYDEKDNWDAFALASGVSRKGLVLARYALGGAAFVPLFGIGFLFLLIPSLRTAETVSALLVFGGVGCLVMAAALPTAFRVGVEKARAAYTVIIVCALALSIGISALFGQFGAGLVWPSAAVFAIGAAAAAVSVRISLAIYGAKDF